MKMFEKLKKNKDVQVWSGMIIGSLIYSISIVFVLDLGNFFAGGVTGIAQIIVAFISKILGNNIDMIGLKSILIVLINIPLVLIGWKGVSKRFAIVSVGSIILQTVLMALFEYIQSKGFDPLASIAENNDILTLAILGGLMTGVGSGLCLKNGASSGGIEMLSQYLSLNKKVSFSKFTLGIDLLIILFATFIGDVETGVYTLIRMILNVLVIDKVHTIYNYLKISIVTDKKEEMRLALIGISNHGVTIYEAIGGYSNQQKYVLESVVSSYETFEITKIAKEIDAHCFISYTSIRKVDGQFNHNVIA